MVRARQRSSLHITVAQALSTGRCTALGRPAGGGGNSFDARHADATHPRLQRPEGPVGGPGPGWGVVFRLPLAHAGSRLGPRRHTGLASPRGVGTPHRGPGCRLAPSSGSHQCMNAAGPPFAPQCQQRGGPLLLPANSDGLTGGRVCRPSGKRTPGIATYREWRPRGCRSSPGGPNFTRERNAPSEARSSRTMYTPDEGKMWRPTSQ